MPLAFLRRELSGLLDLLLPPACPLCGTTLTERPAPLFCAACRAAFPPLAGASCPRCALPYPLPAGSDHLCEDCLRQPPPFLWVRCLGLYEDGLRAAVQRFKYQGAIGLDRPLARLLGDVLTEEQEMFRPDLLVAVPLHYRRLRARGYNQALLLARELGRRWQVPAPARLLRRSCFTPPQQGLDAAARRRNLKGAFALSRELDGERVLLIDDVLTTGATARECARTLLDGGAGQVAVAVLARARRHGR